MKYLNFTLTKFSCFSDDKKHRYSLSRSWGKNSHGKKVLYIMLNPSKASHEIDDHTTTKLIKFSKIFGFSSYAIVNLFSRIASDPDDLLNMENPTCEMNKKIIIEILNKYKFDKIVYAWGNTKILKNFNIPEIGPIWLNNKVEKSYCFKRLTDGLTPGHPSRIGYENIQLSLYHILKDKQLTYDVNNLDQQSSDVNDNTSVLEELKKLYEHQQLVIEQLKKQNEQQQQEIENLKNDFNNIKII